MHDVSLDRTLVKIELCSERLAALNSGAKEVFPGEKKMMGADLSRLNENFEAQLMEKFPPRRFTDGWGGKVLCGFGIAVIFVVGAGALAWMFRIMITSFSYYPVR